MISLHSQKPPEGALFSEQPPEIYQLYIWFAMPITELVVAVLVAVMMRRCQKRPIENTALPDRGV